MNSFYGSTLTDTTRFRDIRICTTKRQVLKFAKLPNFHSYKNIIFGDLLDFLNISLKEFITSFEVLDFNG